MRHDEIRAELVQIRDALRRAESESGANSALKAGALLDMLLKRIDGEAETSHAIDDLDAQGRADIAAHPEAGGDTTGPADMEPFWQYHDPSL